MPNFITPKECKTKWPLKRPEFIEGARRAIGNILHGTDPRLLLVVGPCSIHNIACAKEYAKQLHALSCEVSDVFYICMRTYFEKARTSLGWKGLLYDPHLDGSHNIQDGIGLARELLSYLSELGLPAGSEFLEPLSYSYIGDGVSWGSIGARCCQSPVHRQLASSLPMPVGIKNRCDGSIDIAIQGIITARESHHFLGIDQEGRACQIRSSGNPLAHLVLRGSDKGPNYDPISIERASECLRKAGLLDAVIVDCSHDNSQKNYKLQKQVFSAVLEQIACTTTPIRGIMVESNLLAGSSVGTLHKDKGLSITDACLDWETTEQMVRQGAHLLRQKVISCV
jgi:3-deoxy-7-phosphoheptulonate synthase